jgi:ElaB/YqjD/DUF883 family membrane-anchored ribosome-binding protein
MDTNRNGIYGTDLRMPSGSEVEAATLHVPVGDLGCGCGMQSGTHHHEHVASSESSGLRSRIDALKSQGLSRVHALQHDVSERSALMTNRVKTNWNQSLTRAKRSVTTMQSSLRDGTTTRVNDMQTSMRTNPMKWAGIAAGSGFALGLIGRIAQWRSKHRNVMPSLVVIERSC